MELKIFDKQGLVKMTVSPDNSSQWNHEVGVENVVTVNFTTWEFLVLEVGWYILVEGQRFSIKSEYRPKHIHDTKYTYNLKFYGREHDSQDILFCRLNQGEDDLESVFAYDGTPMDFLQKVVANMNRNTDGVVWKAGEAISANRQTINFNGLYCWDALGEIARAFGTEWWMDGEYLNISKCERGESVSLGYGQGLKSGLTQNENTNAVKWFTRLIPVGSSKNIDKNKYGYANLQLPGREKYIDINTQYGLKEYREEAAFSEIYPHRVGTISSVRSEERTNEETGNYTVYFVKDSSLPFNPDEYMIGGEVIHMTFNSGALAGKDFEVNWNNETKEFEIINQYPDENTQLPGGNLVPSADDTYVLWNISMPDEYIRAAEQELKTAVDVYLAEYSKDISVYSGSTDYIYISKNNVPLSLGQRVLLLSEIYFGNIGRDSRITRISRKLNNLNEATIECGNVVSSSWKSNVSSSINNIAVSQQNTAKKQESQQKEIDKLNVLSELWEVRKDSQGHVFLYTKYDIATLKGITMYADGGELNLPSIFAGLPFDNQTIWLNPETGVIEVIGGTGGGSIDSIHWNNIEGKPSFATVATSGKYSDLSEKPDLTKYALQSEIPSLSGYATEKWVTDKNYLDSTKLSDELAKYVTIDEDETINGVKDFTNGLMICGLPLTKMEDDVVYLDANLVVRGGITMFGTGEDVDVPTIMDALSVDGVNLQVINGVLTFVGEATGGVADSVRWENVIGRPTLLSSFTDDVVKGKYLPLSGGTISNSSFGPLTIHRDNAGYSAAIKFSNKTDGALGYIAINGSGNTQYNFQPVFETATNVQYKIWHSGNDGAGSGLDADMLDGLQPSALNVLSASKLTTARTIWGQSFNGTGNVDGTITITNGGISTVIKSFVDGGTPFTTIGGDSPIIINNSIGDLIMWKGANNRQMRINKEGNIFFVTTDYSGWTTSYTIRSNDNSNTLGSICGAYGTVDTVSYIYYGGTSYQNPAMAIKPDLKIGVGTVNPEFKLHVVGPIKAEVYYGHDIGAVPSTMRWGMYQYNSLLQITKRDSSNAYLKPFVNFNFNTDTAEFFGEVINNNATADDRKCSMSGGDFKTYAPSTNVGWASGLSAHTSGNANLGTVAGAFGTGSTLTYFFYGGGYNSHAMRLTGNNMLVTGGITMYSDIRKKTKLQDVELSLSQIANAPLIEHYYNSDDKHTTHVGSIAQYWASLNDWFCKKDNEGFYTMEIQNAALASAISIARELVKYESKTDKKIRLLNKRIKELEDEIEKLKIA